MVTAQRELDLACAVCFSITETLWKSNPVWMISPPDQKSAKKKKEKDKILNACEDSGGHGQPRPATEWTTCFNRAVFRRLYVTEGLIAV